MVFGAKIDYSRKWKLLASSGTFRCKGLSNKTTKFAQIKMLKLANLKKQNLLN